MTKKKKGSVSPQSVLAAGGIVTRGKSRPLIAVVQLRRQKTWMLPKGKLNRNETARKAGKREAIEETGHDVSVHEYLGSLSYISGGRPKTVKFWRMQAGPKPVSKLAGDVRAVKWLPLRQAIRKLSHERERAFLDAFGAIAIATAAQDRSNRPKKAGPPEKKSRAGGKERPARTKNPDTFRRAATSGGAMQSKTGRIARKLLSWLRP